MAEKKHSAFALLHLLQEESDEDHILSAPQIMEKLKTVYGIELERRTLYSNVEILRQAGYEISDFHDNGKGYYLISRQFEKGEVLLLCNAIHASHYISSRQSNELIEKLLDTLSIEKQKEFRSSVYLPNRQKTENKQLFLNIDLVSEAIRDRRAIQFTYMRYDITRHMVPRREEPYQVEPRYIVYADGRPYMIVTSRNHPNYSHYRLDRMENLKVLEVPAPRLPRGSQEEAYQYAANKLFMFAGEPGWVSFRCQNRIMDQMVDVFGPEMKMLPDDGEHFLARVSTTEDGALFLAQQFMDAIEITDPPELRERMRKRISEVRKLYSR